MSSTGRAPVRSASAVALEAGAHRCMLLTLDERVQPAYERLGVVFAAIAA